MAHESREKYFDYLRKELGDVPFSIDKVKGHKGHIGVWKNCKRAWEMHDPKADYHVVIQDDAVLCKGFRKKAEDFINQFHTDKKLRGFSFFYGDKLGFRDMGMQGKKDGCVFRSSPNWGVAICMPTHIIQKMIEECDKMYQPEDDVRISKFTKKIGMVIVFPIPSLVDHREEDVSLVGDKVIRKALFFIDNEK